MKKRFKKIQIILVTAISLFIMALPAYLRYTKLLQTQFVSSDLSFANPDREEGLPDNEKKMEGFELSYILMMSFWVTNLFEQSSHLFPRSFFLCQKTLFLRC
jgi:hypothetical protein